MKRQPEGQTSIFDLLEPETQHTTPEPTSHQPTIPALYPPLSSCGLYCIWCGREYNGGYNGFDYQHNHNGIGIDYEDTEIRMCTSMSLTKNHLAYAMDNLETVIRNATIDTRNAIPTPCCWGKNDLHGKHIRKPTVEQWAEHMRDDAKKAISTWGIRSAALRAWYRERLAEDGIEQHGYQLPFTATTGPGKYQDEFCAYCGTRKNLNEGGCGPAGNSSPGYSYHICDPCSDKYRTMRPPTELWTFKETQ